MSRTHISTSSTPATFGTFKMTARTPASGYLRRAARRATFDCSASPYPRGMQPRKKQRPSRAKRREPDAEAELPERDTLSHIGSPTELDETLEALGG